MICKEQLLCCQKDKEPDAPKEKVPCCAVPDTGQNPDDGEIENQPGTGVDA
jgi:hypothetical protein